MLSVCRHQAFKLPDSLPVLPELRGKNGCGAGQGRPPGKDTGAALMLPLCRSPEGFRQRCGHLRRGAGAEAGGPPQPAAGGEHRLEARGGVGGAGLGWAGLGPTLPLCSAHLFAPSPAGRVPQDACCHHTPCRKSPCKGQCPAGRGGGTKPFCQVYELPLGVPRTPHPVPADHDGNGDGGTEF